MKKYMKKIIQTGFLGFFLFLVLTGRQQLWMGLLLFGIAASLFLGRFYCGWICSINTVMDGATALKKKLGIKNREIPKILKKPYVRWGLLGLFIVSSVFVMRTGRQIPILPILFFTGFGLTLFFHEELWHRFLCPYGSLLSLSAKNTKKGMTVDPQTCDNCGDCMETCPALAVGKDENTHFINRSDCLVCMRCYKVCQPGAISYK